MKLCRFYVVPEPNKQILKYTSWAVPRPCGLWAELIRGAALARINDIAKVRRFGADRRYFRPSHLCSGQQYLLYSAQLLFISLFRIPTQVRSCVCFFSLPSFATYWIRSHSDFQLSNSSLIITQNL